MPASASSQHQDSSSTAASQPPRYVPPHRSNGSIASENLRYSKEQLLDLYKAQQSSSGGLQDELPNLFLGGWQPDATNGASASGWTRSEQIRDSQPGPEVCWDKDGVVEPLGLIELNDEEREVRYATTSALVLALAIR